MRAMRLLCASTVDSRLSGGKPSSFTISLSLKSMQSNWFCDRHTRVSAPARRQPALARGRHTHLADRQVFDAAQLVACARGRIAAGI